MLLVSAMFGLPDRATAQPSGIAIQNVTLREDTGIITIVGSGFDRELAVTVDGQAAAVLPGGTDTQIEVLAPPSVLQTAGTYRLTVIDRLRKGGDAFVVASHTTTVSVGSGALKCAPTAAPCAALVPIGPGAVGLTATAVAPFAGGPAPMMFEDSGPPFQTALGYLALANSGFGYFNTAVGFSALEADIGGSYNTATGTYALWKNESGSNTAHGAFALNVNTSGGWNTATGSEALNSNTTGSNNTASGESALFKNTASSNTADGARALYNTTTGGWFFKNTASSNTADGARALYNTTTGGWNVAVGDRAGYNATTGSYSVFLGAGVTGTAADTNTIRIGLPYGGGLGQNKTFIAGIHGTQLTQPAVQVFIDANGQLGTLTAPIATGTGTVGSSAAPQQATTQAATNDELRTHLARLDATNAELRARPARVEALLQSVSGRK